MSDFSWDGPGLAEHGCTEHDPIVISLWVGHADDAVNFHTRISPHQTWAQAYERMKRLLAKLEWEVETGPYRCPYYDETRPHPRSDDE